jgi:hypothetical protein
VIQKHFFTNLAISTSPSSMCPLVISPTTTLPSGYAVPSFAVTSVSACFTKLFARWFNVQMYGSEGRPSPGEGFMEERSSSSWVMMRRVAEEEEVS